MPTYEYHCDHCDKDFAAYRSYTDDSLPPCTFCGKEPRKLFVPPTIVFKGSGWYKTDSRPKQADEGGAKPADKPAETKAEAKGDGKAETKSESKSTSESKSDSTKESKAESKSESPKSGDKAGSGSSSSS